VVDPSFLQSVNVSILPRSDNTYDLGSSSYWWRNLYLKGDIIIPDFIDIGSTERTLQYFLPRLLKENIFAFTDIVSIEYYDEASGQWVTWDTTSWRNMFDGKPTDSTFIADATHKKFRIVLTKDYWEHLYWLVLYTRNTGDAGNSFNTTIGECKYIFFQ